MAVALTTNTPDRTAPTTAVLKGSLTDLGASSSVEVCFKYGPLDNSGQITASSQTAWQTLTALGDFEATVTGLDPTLPDGYGFYAYAGEYGQGSMVSFNLAPTFTGSGVTNNYSAGSHSSSDFTGTLSDIGGFTGETLVFSAEYGTDTSYGYTTTATDSLTATGSISIGESGDLSISGGEEYHCRLKLVTAGYTFYGEDQTFYYEETALTQAANSLSYSAGEATLNGNLVSLGDSATDVDVYFEYDSDSSLSAPSTTASQIKSATGSFTAGLSGLNVSTRYYFRAVVEGDNFTNKGEILSFCLTPTVTTLAAQEVDDNSSLLCGDLENIGGVSSVDVSFEYGTTTVYGSTTATQTLTAAGPFSKTITSLDSDTTYHFRAKMTDGATTWYGVDQVFVTAVDPPTLSTDAATNVQTSSATLNGEVTALGDDLSDVDVYFEYSPYGAGGLDDNPFTTSSQNVAAGPTSVTADLSGLSDNSTYHFRLVAENGSNRFEATAQDFTTFPSVKNWANRVAITLDNTNIDSDLTHFPVPLKLNSACGVSSADITNIFTELGSNKLKIAVTESDEEAQLYVEVAKWDTINQEAVLWVSRDNWVLSSSATTTLYLFYDATVADNTAFVGVTASTPAKLVWKSEFDIAFHFGDSDGSIGDNPETLYDSAQSERTATLKVPDNHTLTDAGPVGNCLDTAEDSNRDNYISSWSIDEGSLFSNAFWIKIDFYKPNDSQNLGTGYPIEDKLDSAYGVRATRYTVDTVDDILRAYFEVSQTRENGTWMTYSFTDVAAQPSESTWERFWVTFGETDLKLYKNGSLAQTILREGTPGTSHQPKLFKNTDYTACDELYSLSEAATAAWIKTDYYAQSDQIATYGEVEAISSTSAGLEASFPALTINIEAGTGEVARLSAKFPSLSLTATGKPGSTADLEASFPALTLEINSSPHGDIEASFPSLVGRFGNVEEMEASFPALTADMTGGAHMEASFPSLGLAAYTGADIQASFPALTANIHAEKVLMMDMEASFPALTASWSASWSNVRIEASFPALKLSAEAGEVGDIGAIFPSLTMDAYSGAEVVASFPAFSLSSSASIPRTGDISSTFPSLSLVAYDISTPVGDIAASLPSLFLSADLTTGEVGKISSTLPALKLRTTGKTGETGDISATFPMLTSRIIGSEGGSNTVVATLPMPTLLLKAESQVCGVLRYVRGEVR